MTAAAAPLPPWLIDAVVGLVASAYQAGRADATAAAEPAAAEPPDSLTLNEAAERLRISMTTLNRLVQSGELDTFPIGRRRFTTPDAVEAVRKRRNN